MSDTPYTDFESWSNLGGARESFSASLPMELGCMQTVVMIVDSDQRMTGSIARELSADEYQIMTVPSGDAALRALAQRQVDIVIADLRMPGMSGMDLLKAICVRHPQTRVILASQNASAEEYRRAMNLGAVELLPRPFKHADLLGALRQAAECESGFRGNLHGITLIDALQMLHFGRRSVSVHLAEGRAIHMRDGEIVDAEHTGERGKPALKGLLATPSGTVHTTALESNAETIHEPFDSLLLDTLREVDEMQLAARNVEIDNSTFDEIFDEASLAAPPKAAPAQAVPPDAKGPMEWTAKPSAQPAAEVAFEQPSRRPSGQSPVAPSAVNPSAVNAVVTRRPTPTLRVAPAAPPRTTSNRTRNVTVAAIVAIAALLGGAGAWWLISPRAPSARGAGTLGSEGGETASAIDTQPAATPEPAPQVEQLQGAAIDASPAPARATAAPDASVGVAGRARDNKSAGADQGEMAAGEVGDSPRRRARTTRRSTPRSRKRAGDRAEAAVGPEPDSEGDRLESGAGEPREGGAGEQPAAQQPARQRPKVKIEIIDEARPSLGTVD